MLLRATSLAFAASLALAAPAAMAEPAPTVAAEHVSQSVTHTAPAPSQQDGTSYAAREHQDKQAANYEGGSVVVVGISGGAILVLLLLLLILA